MKALIDRVIESRPRDLGGFTVRRTLPSPTQRLVGPFIFCDHMGPASHAPGEGIDVRPHPHIGLATITYLFEGELVHRDSVGSVQRIVPGDVNWMIGGRGIVHSERTGPEVRARGGRVHGIQTWVALPMRDEETTPRFEHHPLQTIPAVRRHRTELRVLAGTAYGVTAPTGVLSPTLYVHARLEDDATLEVDGAHEERAVYVADGSIGCDDSIFGAGTMIVLHPHEHVTVHATGPANLMLIGGAPMDGPRHIWWNFVASSPELIERAKSEWREGAFPKVPGDDDEFIPLPDRA